MHYRRFGRTEWMVSEVALSARPLASADPAAVEETLTAALAAGINLLTVDARPDTPELEELIGRVALRRYVGDRCPDNRFYVSRQTGRLHHTMTADDGAHEGNQLATLGNQADAKAQLGSTTEAIFRGDVLFVEVHIDGRNANEKYVLEIIAADDATGRHDR